MTEHPYWLRGITLRNFKSVGEADISLRPFTVIVGANSSGKSTLIQAILALRQAFESESTEPKFPLNGKFVRLGSFDEVQNIFATDGKDQVAIGCEIVVHHRGHGLWNLPPMFPPMSFYEKHYSNEHHYGFRYEVMLGSSQGAIRSSRGYANIVHANLVASLLDTIGSSEAEQLIVVDVKNVSNEVSSIFIELEPSYNDYYDISDGDSTDPRDLVLEDDFYLSSGNIKDWANGKTLAIEGIAIKGALLGMVLTNELILCDVFASLHGYFDAFSRLPYERDALEDYAIRINANEELYLDSAIATFCRQLSVLYPLYMQKSEWEFRAEIERVLEILEFEELASLYYLSQNVSYSELMSLVLESPMALNLLWPNRLQTVDVVVKEAIQLKNALLRSQHDFREYFRDAVRYLGPLREVPRVLYDQAVDFSDIGMSGENLAAVLEHNLDLVIHAPMPGGLLSETRLSEALNAWLKEFGLADSVEARDQGRLGIGLDVKPAGFDHATDLTSLGVGVSQVLPVLVLCLLSEPGTVVILEQPELHLHPKLQQDLADFFLACIESGRQIIVETHSDHLVNRLRYRIAEDETDETQSLVKLLFAEKEDGITTYREPEINEFGGLGDDWPSGFLDLTSKQSQALVRQALLKKKLRASEN